MSLVLSALGTAAARKVRSRRANALDQLVRALDGEHVHQLEPILGRLLEATATDADSRWRTCPALGYLIRADGTKIVGPSRRQRLAPLPRCIESSSAIAECFAIESRRKERGVTPGVDAPKECPRAWTR